MYPTIDFSYFQQAFGIFSAVGVCTIGYSLCFYSIQTIKPATSAFGSDLLHTCCICNSPNHCDGLCARRNALRLEGIRLGISAPKDRLTVPTEWYYQRMYNTLNWWRDCIRTSSVCCDPSFSLLSLLSSTDFGVPSGMKSSMPMRLPPVRLIF